MIARAPASSAFATATTMPRSLNEPVGFWPSTLACRFDSPSRAPSRREADERREALAEVSARRRVGDRQERAVALDQRRAGVGAGGDRARRRTDPVGPRVAGAATGRRGRPAHVLPSPRAIATRSPRTALDVAAPPAPGPLNATVPDGLGLDLDPVQDAGGPPERRVRPATARRQDATPRSTPSPRRVAAAAASSLIDLAVRAAPRRCRPAPTPVIPGRPRARPRRRSRSTIAPGRARRRTRAGPG